MADVVASAEAFSSTDALREIWDVTSEVAVGTALINGTRAGVAYTPSGGHVAAPKTVGPVTVSGFADGGVGLDALKVSVATDGSYEFPVTGATVNTKNGTAVYAIVDTGKVTGLTTTATGNSLWGVVNNPADYKASASAICVKIGV